MRVVFLPQFHLYKGNPYWELLKASLEREGVEFISTEDDSYLQWRWLVKNRGQVDVIHLHFLQHHYTANDRFPLVRLLLKFIGKLLLARLLGYHIVWTVHNLYPHEQLELQYIGRLAHVAVAQLASAIIVHCEYARKALAKEFRRRRNVYSIAHPNYISAYPNTVSKQKARAILGLEDNQRIFLFLGTLRPYKGLGCLVEAFHRIPDYDLRLIIAGKPWHTMPDGTLDTITQNDKRITIFPRFIPDEELQIFFNAADLVVLPFTNVLSSGSALLAMSFGCPVIAPAIGCLTETITQESGILYHPSAPDGLYKALLQAQALELEPLRRNAYERASQLTWEGMARKTLQAYHIERTLPKELDNPVRKTM